MAHIAAIQRISFSMLDASVFNLLPTAELPTALCFTTDKHTNSSRWEDESSHASVNGPFSSRNGSSSDRSRSRSSRSGMEVDLTAGLSSGLGAGGGGMAKERGTLCHVSLG